MKSIVLVVFLVISILERLYPVNGDNGIQEFPSKIKPLESKCNGYCFSILKPILDNAVKLQSESIFTDELKEQVISLKGTIENLHSELQIAKEQIKYRDDLLKEKTGELKIKDNSNMQSQLVIADCQTHNKDLINLKVKEIVDITESLKSKNDLINLKDKQIVEQSDKVNSMAETIKKLQKQLENSEEQIKLKDELVSLKNKEINDKSNELKSKDGQLLLKEKDIMDKSEQIKNIGEEINTKDKQLMNLSAQISTKNNEIDGLNHQTKSDLGKITNLIDELSLCRGWESCPTGRPDGIYKIIKPGIDVFEAPCNSTGWMTIQRRQDGSVDFNLNWVNYKNGFGNLTGELFIGLEKLHQMTKDKPHELYIKLVKFNGESAYAHYDNFHIGSEQELYELKSLGKFSGTAWDSLRYHEGMKFSTFDSDNDKSRCNCAKRHTGGWWYNNCSFRYIGSYEINN